MAQRYLPGNQQRRQARAADRRQAGAVLPCAYPKAGETRGNLAAGGTGVARELTARDREIAESLGPQPCRQRGLLLVGLDVIGDCLTEVNVTSPTCFQEITSRPASTWPRCARRD
jgi:glutathione synthase